MKPVAAVPADVARKLGYYVSVLVDPDTREVFYVGKGKAGRALSHLQKTNRKDGPRETHRSRNPHKEYGDSWNSMTPTILAHKLVSENVAVELSEGTGVQNEPIFGVAVAVMRLDGMTYRAGDRPGEPIRSALFYTRAAAEAHISVTRKYLPVA